MNRRHLMGTTAGRALMRPRRARLRFEMPEQKEAPLGNVVYMNPNSPLVERMRKVGYDVRLVDMEDVGVLAEGIWNKTA